MGPRADRNRSMTSPAAINRAHHLKQVDHVNRRYAVVHRFDSAFLMLGLPSGCMLGGRVQLPTVIAAHVGAAVALGVSGPTIAYLSESTERQRSLAELESAMITDFPGSDDARAARLLPWLVAPVNGASPVLASLLIIGPLGLAQPGVLLPGEQVVGAFLTALASIFGLGAFFGGAAGTSGLFSGIETRLIALVTMLLILSL